MSIYMKTSELIESLKKRMEKYGDKEVVINHDTELFPIDECYYDSWNDIIVIAE